MRGELLGIDIGGSKTLVAIFDADGQILRHQKFPTPKNYQKFLSELASTLQALDVSRITHVCCAAPGKIDRQRGVVLAFGNEAWRNAPLGHDVSKLLGGLPVLVENDANLAGLSEALLVQARYKKVLYLTVSTGIGDGIIINGIIDPQFADGEAGQMMLVHGDKLAKWEDFASGRALFARYGKKASEIDDPAIWLEFVKGLAQGIGELMAVLTPEVIIIGGGVGAHFDKFGSLLRMELKKYESKLVKLPPVVQAKRPEEAVIYGCYALIRQKAS